MTRTLLYYALGIAVVLAIMMWGMTFLWEGLGAGMSGHGWFAYALGGGLTVALSSGLFLLTFYSARNGYDDIDRPEDGPDAE